MLSFQKSEQDLDNIGNDSKGTKPADKGPVDSGEQFITVADKAKQVNKTTKMLVLLSVIGLLCLWFMIKSASPDSAEAEEQNPEEMRIEMAIAELTGIEADGTGQVDSILRKFNEMAGFEQVKAEELVKNPFAVEDFLGGLDSSADSDDIQDAFSQPRVSSGELYLVTIMESPRGNSCMINDELLYEGDTIKGLEITKIGSDFVELASGENTRITLKLDE